ncbi:adhesion G-protein coupled receptor G6-like isoform X2 [Bolinopsis microptera]|uniref:adhesion G-protein coupled receptor G6-like isoform X2 n=1 Tax=Bolinopsis microptera TaxID=2820187 RepID=UPI0030795289
MIPANIGRQLTGTIEVTCLKDEEGSNVGKLSASIICGTKIHLMTHLGEGLEYVPQQQSAILNNQVIRVGMIYSRFKTAVTSRFADLNASFLDEKIFRYISKERTLLQTNLLVIPSQLTLSTSEDLENIISKTDADIEKLKDLSFSLDSGETIVISHAERTFEGKCGGLTEVNNKGSYIWNGTNQTLPCDFNKEVVAHAVSKCTCDDDTGLCVLDTTGAYDNCSYKSNKTKGLDELNKEDISPVEKADKLKDMTEDLSEEDIDEDGYDIGANTISDILEADTESLRVDKVQRMNENVLDVIDKFANAGGVVAYKEAVATDKYLKALDKVLLNTDAPTGGSKEISKSNMRMALLSVPKDTDKQLTLSCSSKKSDGGVHITAGGSAEVGDDLEIVMEIPKGIRKSLKDNNKFYFVVFEKSTFFTTEELFTGKKKLQSKVFSAGVAGIPDIRRISPPINFKMRTQNSSAEYKSECVYWRDTGGGVREREIKKVTTLESSTKEIIHCQTDHLTSFAILMSSTPLAEIHEEILNVITYLGCSLSIIGLILSLVGLSVFRVIRKPMATKVHINMSAALLLANVTFMVGIDEVGSPIACLICGLLCHYFFLAAILWMGVEGFHLYVMIVRVFGHLSNRFLLKCAAFAWGFPAVMVAATLGWDVNNYETIKFCWLTKTPMICFFMAPVMIVILINTYMFIRVTQEITKSQNRKTDNLPSNQQSGLSDVRDKLVQVRASVSVMVLLGLAWILGPLMLLDMVPALTTSISYLFTVCNSLQGFLFFFFHCAIKTDVKERWKTYLGLEMSHSQMSDFSKTYNKQNSKPQLTNQKTTEFSKLGDSAASLNKSLLSFKPKNKIKPGRPDSPEDDSELAIVDF